MLNVVLNKAAKQNFAPITKIMNKFSDSSKCKENAVPVHTTGQFSIFCATDTLWSVSKEHCGSISSCLGVFPLAHRSATHHWLSWFVSPIFSLSEGKLMDQFLPFLPICCQKHWACSLSVSLAKKNMSSLSFHLDVLAKWKGRWRERARQNKRERERADCQWEALSGRQHKLVWGKFNNRGQEAKAVSPLCLFDLPLTWVYLKPGRDSSTVWCVL